MVAKACLLRLLLVYRNDVLLCERNVKIPVKSRDEDERDETTASLFCDYTY